MEEDQRHEFYRGSRRNQEGVWALSGNYVGVNRLSTSELLHCPRFPGHLWIGKEVQQYAMKLVVSWNFECHKVDVSLQGQRWAIIH